MQGSGMTLGWRKGDCGLESSCRSVAGGHHRHRCRCSRAHVFLDCHLVLGRGCHQVLASILTLQFESDFEQMWCSRASGLSYCISWIVFFAWGSWMPGFPHCTDVDQLLDSGCSGCWGSQDQTWMEGHPKTAPGRSAFP